MGGGGLNSMVLVVVFYEATVKMRHGPQTLLITAKREQKAFQYIPIISWRRPQIVGIGHSAVKASFADETAETADEKKLTCLDPERSGLVQWDSLRSIPASSQVCKS